MAFSLYLTALALVHVASIALSAFLLWAVSRMFGSTKLAIKHLVQFVLVSLLFSGLAAVVFGDFVPRWTLMLVVLASLAYMVYVLRRQAELCGWRVLLSLLVVLMVGGLAQTGVGTLLHSSIASAYSVSSKSMVPTLAPGDRVLADRTLDMRRWDLVVYKSPGDASVVFVSRIAGMPGDSILIQDGIVIVNGKEVSMPEEIRSVRYSSKKLYSLEQPAFCNAGEGQPVSLAGDEYFLLSDNTEQALDSRYFPPVSGSKQAGAIPRDMMLGVVRIVYAPPSRAKVVR